MGSSTAGTSNPGEPIIRKGVLVDGKPAIFWISYSSEVGSSVSVLPSMVLGDVNDDNVVNCLDIDLVKASLGRAVGESGFNPNADLNNDGVIDIRDLAVVSQHLPSGTHCR